MIQSMTGYGKTELSLESGNFSIELKSLNSKQIDINIKAPSTYRDQDINIRKLLAEKLNRGKIDLFIFKKSSEANLTHTVNQKVVENYYDQILKIRKSMKIKWNMLSFRPFSVKSTDIIPTLLGLPNVIQKEDKTIEENHWDEILEGIRIAINNLCVFRIKEGEKLQEDFLLRIKIIEELLELITPFAKKRITERKTSLTEKIMKNQSGEIDQNRLEQELIYYLEKQDITEEQIRLSSHLNYFKEVMKTDFPNGKKLGFITQEMGREINTIGSKSSDAELQKIVVQMKDELEKIKEQLLNVL